MPYLSPLNCNEVCIRHEIDIVTLNFIASILYRCTILHTIASRLENLFETYPVSPSPCRNISYIWWHITLNRRNKRKKMIYIDVNTYLWEIIFVPARIIDFSLFLRHQIMVIELPLVCCNYSTKWFTNLNILWNMTRKYASNIVLM